MLSEILLTSLNGSSAEPPVPARLEERLADLVRAGTAAWPGLPLPAAVFVRHLGARLPAGEDVDRALAGLCAEDLYLACACAHGIVGAARAFEERFLGRVAAFVGRVDNDPIFADEIRQLVRHRLLVGDGGRGPRVAEYAGRGALGSWVRVVALRIALQLQKRDGARHQHGDAVLLERLAADGDLEEDHIRARYLPEFKEALKIAFAGLSAKQRNLLRLYFLERLGTTQIAGVLQVDRATVKRWLATARQGIFAESKRLLRERFQLDSTEFHSLMRILRSHLDLSLSVFFMECEQLQE